MGYAPVEDAKDRLNEIETILKNGLYEDREEKMELMAEKKNLEKEIMLSMA